MMAHIRTENVSLEERDPERNGGHAPPLRIASAVHVRKPLHGGSIALDNEVIGGFAVSERFQVDPNAQVRPAAPKISFRPALIQLLASSSRSPRSFATSAAFGRIHQVIPKMIRAARRSVQNATRVHRALHRLERRHRLRGLRLEFIIAPARSKSCPWSAPWERSGLCSCARSMLFDRLSGVVVFCGASLVVCAMKVPMPANGSDAQSEAQTRPCCGGASRSISGTYEQIRLD